MRHGTEGWASLETSCKVSHSPSLICSAAELLTASVLLCRRCWLLYEAAAPALQHMSQQTCASWSFAACTIPIALSENVATLWSPSSAGSAAWLAR